MRRREHVDAVVSPSEPPIELGDRHQLDRRDAQPRELPELGLRTRKRSFLRERAHMEFVDDLICEFDAPPSGVVPLEGPGIDDLRRAVRPTRLEPGGGIRVELVGSVKTEVVFVARPCFDYLGEVSGSLGVKSQRPMTAGNHEVDSPHRG